MLGMLMRRIDRTLAALARLLIRAYQVGVSPLIALVFGPLSGCRFEPTCSRYAAECLRVHSFPRALFLIVRRILRCHPFHSGGPDPVPPRKSE